jgi:hypothetical protein
MEKLSCWGGAHAVVSVHTGWPTTARPNPKIRLDNRWIPPAVWNLEELKLTTRH